VGSAAPSRDRCRGYSSRRATRIRPQISSPHHGMIRRRQRTTAYCGPRVSITGYSHALRRQAMSAKMKRRSGAKSQALEVRPTPNRGTIRHLRLHSRGDTLSRLRRDTAVPRCGRDGLPHCEQPRSRSREYPRRAASPTAPVSLHSPPPERARLHRVCRRGGHPLFHQRVGLCLSRRPPSPLRPPLQPPHQACRRPRQPELRPPRGHPPA
jgi:hypothetical protein